MLKILPCEDSGLVEDTAKGDKKDFGKSCDEGATSSLVEFPLKRLGVKPENKEYDELLVGGVEAEFDKEFANKE